MHQISPVMNRLLLTKHITEPQQIKNFSTAYVINDFRVFSQTAAKIDLALTDRAIWQETAPKPRQTELLLTFVPTNDSDTAEFKASVRECNNARRGEKAD